MSQEKYIGVDVHLLVQGSKPFCTFVASLTLLQSQPWLTSPRY